MSRVQIKKNPALKMNLNVLGGGRVVRFEGYCDIYL